MGACVLAASFLAGNRTAIAQSAQNLSKNWQLLDYVQDSLYGTEVEKAYKELLQNKKSTPVIVAVIDSGIDTTHEDLKPVLWVNPGEIPGNGVDDDHNGYIDDVHGWNFLGGKKGGSVKEDSEEATREYFRLKKLYAGKDSAQIADPKAYAYWKKVKEKVEKTAALNEVTYKTLSKMFHNLNTYDSLLQQQLGKADYTVKDLEKIQQADSATLRAKRFAYNFLSQEGEEMTFSQFKSDVAEYINSVKKKAQATTIEPEDVRARIIGDDYNNINDRYYGNNDVMGTFAFHGTHVSGIIAAVRNNGIGMDGIANNVKIMMVKAIPDGDERDKDVANAIRYAVDNGAQIINMSFGKGFSPQKQWVDDALRYAQQKGVLLVHAAGNESSNDDEVENFPNDTFLDTHKEADNFINVGAIAPRTDNKLVAGFSNYGKKEVDVFAPGVAIYSTVPEGNHYSRASGTSMAAPVVAGVAALVLSYYPTLSARQLKYVIEKSATPLPGLKVTEPGTTEEVEFSSLSKTGGIVNAYEALKLAATIKGERKLPKNKSKMAPIRKG